MSAEWKHGKILWFDDLSGDGMVIDQDGNDFYFHWSAIYTETPDKRRKVKENKKVKFTVYDDGYSTQADKVREV